MRVSVRPFLDRKTQSSRSAWTDADKSKKEDEKGRKGERKPPPSQVRDNKVSGFRGALLLSGPQPQDPGALGGLPPKVIQKKQRRKTKKEGQAVTLIFSLSRNASA